MNGLFDFLNKIGFIVISMVVAGIVALGWLLLGMPNFLG